MPIDLDKLRDGLPKDLHDAFDEGLVRADRDGWTDRIVLPNDALAVARGCYFLQEAQDTVVGFFETVLKHPKGIFAGKPFYLFEWQKQWLGNVYGWKGANGLRRFKRVYLEVAKKNGKTSLAAGLALYELTLSKDVGAEVYSGAVDRKQASITFEIMVPMVEASPDLKKKLVVINSRKTILYINGVDRRKYMALSADTDSHDGENISLSLLDELHRHKNSKMYDVLEQGGVAREESLMIIITTAGVYDVEAIGWQQHEYAQEIIAGLKQDIEFYGLIYGLTDDDEWTDPATWKKANPSLGDRPTREEVRDATTALPVLFYDELAGKVNTAINQPSGQPTLKRLRLNIWNQELGAWIKDMKRWRDLKADFKLEDMEGRDCFAGLDLASVGDMNALSLMFPPLEGEKIWHQWEWNWIPEGNFQELMRKHNPSLQMWKEYGWLLTTDGETANHEIIRDFIVDISKRFTIRELVFDPMFAKSMADNLTDHHGMECVEFRPTLINFTPAMQAYEKMIIDGTLRHRGNPCYAWQLSNVVLKIGGSDTMMPERRLVRKKIDGPVAAIMATGRAVAVGRPKRSKYETEGLTVIGG